MSGTMTSSAMACLIAIPMETFQNGSPHLGVLSKAFCTLLISYNCYLREEDASTCCLVPLVDGRSIYLLTVQPLAKDFCVLGCVGRFGMP